MVSGGKREGSGRKSRKLEVSKISAYVEDRETLNKLAKLLKIPTVELLHQILEHKDFPNFIMELQSSENIKEWYKQEL